MRSFIKDYNIILFINLIKIENLEHLKYFEEIIDIITNSINNIFNRLSKMNRKFLNKEDIDLFYKIIYNDIWRLNDALMVSNSDTLVSEVYEIINNIFDEIIKLSEEYEVYELAGNMISLRKHWVEKITLINEE